MDKKMSREEALNAFLTEIFERKMAETFPELEMKEPDRLIYFKLWCSGVRSGMEIHVAVQDLKETEGI